MVVCSSPRTTRRYLTRDQNESELADGREESDMQIEEVGVEYVTPHERPVAWAKRSVTLRLFYRRPSLMSQKKVEAIELRRERERERETKCVAFVTSIRDVASE